MDLIVDDISGYKLRKCCNNHVLPAITGTPYSPRYKMV